MAVGIIHEAQKSSKESHDWDKWIQFMVLEMSCSGPAVLHKMEGRCEKLSEHQIEFLEILKTVVICSDLGSNFTCKEYKEREESLSKTPFPLLKAISCLLIRLRFGISEGFKSFLPHASKILASNSVDSEYPGNIKLDHAALSSMAQGMVELCKLKFQLGEAHLPNLSTGCGFDAVIQAELSVLRLRVLTTGVAPVFNLVQSMFRSTAEGTFQSSQLEPVLRSGLAPSLHQNFQLWKVQAMLQNDSELARVEMNAIQASSDFAPTSFFHLIEAILDLKERKAVHKVKESLLQALKQLNSSSGKNDAMKMCVLLLLASIYQNTDFALAEKMASTAYVYSCNMENDVMAIHSGRILARMMEMRGEEAGAAKQTQINKELESKLQFAD